jgi:hypothetical protein
MEQSIRKIIELKSLRRELRSAKEYWLRTIHPYIANRKLRGVELFVASHAYETVLRRAYNEAEQWNHTEQGQVIPIPLPDFKSIEFSAPEPLYAEECPKPEVLASIAASLLPQSADISPDEAILKAHDLLIAAQRYISSLPHKPSSGTARSIEDLRLATSTITFDEIRKSNKGGPSQLPLLPPVQARRNQGQVTPGAIRSELKRFSARHNWSREKTQESVVHNRILLQDLCQMRWERFQAFMDAQGRRTRRRNT